MTTAGSGEIHGWRTHLAPPETHPAGTELLSQGRMPERVQLLSDGIVKLERRAPDRAPVTIGLRFPGWLLGAESVIAEQETPVSVVAVTPPETRLRHLLRRLLDANDTGHLQKEVHMRLPFTHRELPRLLSVSASQLTALLTGLQRDGVIPLRRDRLIILDLPGLREVDPVRRDVGWPVNA